MPVYTTATRTLFNIEIPNFALRYANSPFSGQKIQLPILSLQHLSYLEQRLDTVSVRGRYMNQVIENRRPTIHKQVFFPTGLAWSTSHPSTRPQCTI